MDQMTTRPRAGRPTREQAEARHAELLDSALDHFLAKGFEQATIEAIAHDVGMTKRTVYARYKDKVSLFRGAINLAVDRYFVADEQFEALVQDDIRETLTAVARLRVNQVMTPNGLRLQRIINTESYRFSELFDDVYARLALPPIRFLSRYLRMQTEAGQLAVAEPDKAAVTFMSMVVSGPVRKIVGGGTLTDDDIDDRIGFAVDLFLNGARTR